MKITVDPELCVGTGSCISLVPQVFEMSNEGVAIVKVDEIPPELEDDVREAIEACPVDAILEA